jgi:hypothetical protein
MIALICLNTQSRKMNTVVFSILKTDITEYSEGCRWDVSVVKDVDKWDGSTFVKFMCRVQSTVLE